MGTRHLTCVVKDGDYKVAQYGQWEGYPDYTGTWILDFLKNKFNKKEFKKKLENVEFISEDELKKLWEEVIGASKEFVSIEESRKFKLIYPELHRDIGCEVLDIINANEVEETIRLQNSVDFATESLYCEWAYVIDLDKNTFEVYEGFNKEPVEESERFSTEDLKEYSSIDEQYYPVKLIKKYDLDNLPEEEEFLDEFKEEEVS